MKIFLEAIVKIWFPRPNQNFLKISPKVLSKWIFALIMQIRKNCSRLPGLFTCFLPQVSSYKFLTFGILTALRTLNTGTGDRNVDTTKLSAPEHTAKCVCTDAWVPLWGKKPATEWFSASNRSATGRCALLLSLYSLDVFSHLLVYKHTLPHKPILVISRDQIATGHRGCSSHSTGLGGTGLVFPCAGTITGEGSVAALEYQNKGSCAARGGSLDLFSQGSNRISTVVWWMQSNTQAHTDSAVFSPGDGIYVQSINFLYRHNWVYITQYESTKECLRNLEKGKILENLRIDAADAINHVPFLFRIHVQHKLPLCLVETQRQRWF